MRITKKNKKEKRERLERELVISSWVNKERGEVVTGDVYLERLSGRKEDKKGGQRVPDFDYTAGKKVIADIRFA